MDSQVSFSVDTGIIPVNTQIITVDHVPGYQTTPGMFGPFPGELWLEVEEHLHSKRDLVRLSSVNKSLHSLLTFARARAEADIRHSYLKRKSPSTLYVALKRGRPLAEIERIVAGYVAGGVSLLETNLACWDPPLHLAVAVNRLDVVKLILGAGVGINNRWAGHIAEACPGCVHTWCEGRGSTFCKNALDIARELKHSKIEQYLLQQGIEDLGRDKEMHGWVRDCYEAQFSVEENWWPALYW
ncbi:hypothetical protein F4680DRAFT_449793 [Xylaria scruposa]|nr:hypothetical protein F4680DRAFT_449793 [Xylaria scruposa]